MSDTTFASKFTTAEQIGAWLETYTDEHRELASLMDSLVSNHYFATCLGDGEADKIYVDLAIHKDNGDVFVGDNAETAWKAIELIWKLDGCWAANGCLYSTAFGLAGFNADEFDAEMFVNFDPCTWETRPSMLNRTDCLV